MLNKLQKYLNNSGCEINIFENNIHVINYKNIIVFDEDNIVLDVDKKNLTVKGTDLVISKLLDNEILIKGNIKIIEIRWLFFGKFLYIRNNR